LERTHRPKSGTGSFFQLRR